MCHHTWTTSHEWGEGQCSDTGSDPTNIFPVIRRRGAIAQRKFRREVPEHGAALPPTRQKKFPATNHKPIRGAIARSRPRFPERAEGTWGELDHRNVHHLITKIIELPPDIHLLELTAGAGSLFSWSHVRSVR
jgi:hypothetical protein